MIPRPVMWKNKSVDCAMRLHPKTTIAINRRREVDHMSMKPSCFRHTKVQYTHVEDILGRLVEYRLFICPLYTSFIDTATGVGPRGESVNVPRLNPSLSTRITTHFLRSILRSLVSEHISDIIELLSDSYTHPDTLM